MVRSPSPERFKYMPLGGDIVERIQTLERSLGSWPVKTFPGLRGYDSLRSTERNKKVRGLW